VAHGGVRRRRGAVAAVGGAVLRICRAIVNLSVNYWHRHRYASLEAVLHPSGPEWVVLLYWPVVAPSTFRVAASCDGKLLGLL